VEEVRDVVQGQLGGERADLVVAFASPHFADAYRDLPALIHELLGCRVVVGCSAAGVIGGGRELEFVPALSITAASLPGVEVSTFHLERDALPDLDGGQAAWRELLDVPADPMPHFLLFADPYSFDPRDLLMGLDFAYPGSAKLGGLASTEPSALFVGDATFDSGLVGVALSGAIAVDPIVAQGCRPLGEPHTVTAARQNLIVSLDDRRPTDVLGQLYASLEPAEQERFREALHVGVAPSSLAAEPDYLIRNVIGVDSRQGLLAVGTTVRTGQTIRFHVRDAKTAEQELTTLLDGYRRAHPNGPAGALLFSCAGRGASFYGDPDRESTLLADSLGAVPVGGFFCGGELGPVGDDSHLLAYTSSLALIREA
jgi:small ligand-binding sensory domain FIST